jgi:chemotaxis signal transduction protein
MDQNSSSQVTEDSVNAPVAQVAARLISYAHDGYIAFPPPATYGLIDNPEIVIVPGAALYAYGLLNWQGMKLPFLDFYALLQQVRAKSTVPRYALIVAYQSAGQLEYGAIGVDALPLTVGVGDADQCELPSGSPLWTSLARSCFQYKGQPVPVIDTTRLFAGYHPPV